MPSLTQLEYIVAVDRLRHFGKAAKACHVSQPSLSMQIQKAEEELGVMLFDRDKKPILPTSKGARLIEQAKAVVREHAQLLHMAKTLEGELSGEFTLGVIPTLAPYLVPRFLHAFAQRHPKVELSIDELKTADIISRLREDRLDAGVMATPLQEAGLRERTLFYEPFYLYLNPQHPLRTEQEVAEEQLQPEELWLLQDGHCFKNQILNYCAIEQRGQRGTSSVRFESGNFETLRNLVRAGQGYTLFPHLFTSNLPADERKAVVRPFAGLTPTREVSLVHRRNHWKEDILAGLEAVIRESLPPEISSLERQGLAILPLDARP